MKGLLVKDIRLMKNMKNSIIMIILIAVGMGSYLKDVSFIITYMALIGATFTSSTLSYDEFDNGYAFLLSLPVTRKGYVMEKYILGLILCGGGWLIGTIITAAAGVIKNTSPLGESLMIAVTLFPFALLLLSVILPFHMKFGGEKGRIIMVAAMGRIFLVTLVGAKVVEKIHIDLNAVFRNLPEPDMGVAAVSALAVGTVLMLLSCTISMKIMNKKEF